MRGSAIDHRTGWLSTLFPNARSRDAARDAFLRARGIETLRYSTARLWREPELVKAAIYKAVATKRQQLDIPNPFLPYLPWTRKEIALLGTMPDDDVAKLTKRPLQAVKSKRIALKIPNRFLKDRPWSPNELRLLGKRPDTVLATEFSRTEIAVIAKRRQLRIRLPPRFMRRRHN